MEVSEFVISFTSHKKREFLGSHFLWARPGGRHEEGCWLRKAEARVKLKPSGGSFFSNCMLGKLYFSMPLLPKRVSLLFIKPSYAPGFLDILGVVFDIRTWWKFLRSTNSAFQSWCGTLGMAESSWLILQWVYLYLVPNLIHASLDVKLGQSWEAQAPQRIATCQSQPCFIVMTLTRTWPDDIKISFF